MVLYKMIGLDVNSNPTEYRTWVANQPDLTGEFYTGIKSGDSPLININVFEICNTNTVVDFNLPDPLNITTSYKVLPKPTYNSQLAVIDGYIYLFGGESDGYIYYAETNNPADWFQSNYTLPNNLSSSQLLIINNTIYLFGGNLGNGPDNGTSNIYSASVSNPFNWSHVGNLPQSLWGSQLGLADGYILLLGGFTSSGATNNIYSAPINNPLTWTITNNILPDSLYNSQVGIIDGYIYLFGGTTANNLPTDFIYYASVNNPFSWTRANYALPYVMSNAQFVAIGNRGYLYGISTNTKHTNILYCNLSNPQYWYDSNYRINGIISNSQLAIIYDRIWLFGGNGSSIIFASDVMLKTNLYSPQEFAYGNITRTQFNAATSVQQQFAIISFNPAKTDY